MKDSNIQVASSHASVHLMLLKASTPRTQKYTKVYIFDEADTVDLNILRYDNTNHNQAIADIKASIHEKASKKLKFFRGFLETHHFERRIFYLHRYIYTVTSDTGALFALLSNKSPACFFPEKKVIQAPAM